MIIDTHVHLYDRPAPRACRGRTPNSPIYRRTLAADCRAVAAPEGVDGVVVVEAWSASRQPLGAGVGGRVRA